LVIATVTAVR